MRPLELNDKCYKFFPLKTCKHSGPGSIVYEENKFYSSEKLSFFRKDEAIKKLRNLVYFIQHGNAMIEINVDSDLVKKAQESSPEHFISNSFTTGKIYFANSTEMESFILEAMRDCDDFSEIHFADIMLWLVQSKGFDTALNVYNTITGEKSIKLPNQRVRMLMELGTQSWRSLISLAEVNECSNMEEYINLLKSRISF